MATPSRKVAQTLASATSKRGLNREARAALLRVRTGPECLEGNLRELSESNPNCGIAREGERERERERNYPAKSPVSDFIFWGSKITADGDCSHEIKSCLLFGRKVMINLDSIFKSRDMILPTKVHLVKAMVFPVVMYGCESWTVKKAEH